MKINKGMEINKFKKGINDIKQISLSSLEKERVFDNLKRYTYKSEVDTRYSSVKSPWSSVFVSRLSYVTVMFLVLGFSSVGVLNFAKRSLPGDRLYSLKVDVIEPLQYKMAVGEVAKANVESQSLNQRLLEVETLESQGKLTEESHSKIENLLKKHTESFNGLISVSSEQEPDSLLVEDARVDFEAKVNAHTRILDRLENNAVTEERRENIQKIKNVIAGTKTEETSFAISVAAAAPAPTNTMIMSKARSVETLTVVDLENDIPVSTTTVNFDDFDKRKTDAENTIKEIKKQIEDNFKSGKNINKDILEDSDNSIRQAEEYLLNAGIKDGLGSRGEALIDLTNSRRAIIEAHTSLEASVKIGEFNLD